MTEFEEGSKEEREAFERDIKVASQFTERVVTDGLEGMSREVIHLSCILILAAHVAQNSESGADVVDQIAQIRDSIASQAIDFYASKEEVKPN